jgi:hypothetical protein
VQLGLGSLTLAALLAASVVYLALRWATKFPLLLLMTVGAHGAPAYDHLDREGGEHDRRRTR